MPSALDVTPGADFFKCMVVAPPGQGKSIFAASFPTPGFVFDCDGGIQSYRGLPFDYEQYTIDFKGWNQFSKDLTKLKKDVEEGKYVTVVVDSTTSMADIAMEKALQLNPTRSDTGGPVWNIHYSMVKNLVEGALRQIISLNCNVVVLSHTEVVKDQKTGNIVGIEPLLPGNLCNKIPGYFDEVYYATTKQEAIKGAPGQPVKSKTVWLLQTVPKGHLKARSRLSGKEGLMPEFIPNDYESLMKAVKGEK